MSAGLIQRLIEAGTPAELIAEVALLSAEVEALERRRQSDRDRQANRRHVMSRDTCDNRDPFLDKKVSHTLPKTKPIQLPPIVPQILEAWNAMAASNGLPQIQSITGKRSKALMARIAEHGEEAVLRAISSVPNSPHWLGANGWLGNFDSLMRPDNFQRMLEGAYAAAGGARPAEQNDGMALVRSINSRRAA